MKLNQVLDRIIEYGFYALFFATPLIFNSSRTLPSFELFEWNKMMFVYLMTSIIGGAWVGKMILQGRCTIAKTPFNLPILLFLLSQSLSTLFSIDRHVSIFGYYSRFHGGLLSTICYTFLFFAFVSNREIIRIKNLFLYALVSGTVVAGYGIAERFGIDAHMWVQDVQSRVFSTLGQPNWLAAYLDVVGFIGLGSVISNVVRNPHRFTNTQRISRFARDNKVLRLLSSILLITIFYICLLFTKSRSGFLGFWIANAVFWSFSFYSSREADASAESRSSRLLSNNIFPLFIILNSIFFIFNFFIRTPFPLYNHYLTTEAFQKTPIVDETKPSVGDTIISVGVTGSEKIREIVWKGAFAIIKDYPLFGTGPETFAYAYYKYRPIEHNLTSEWDFLYNRAHNEFLNVAATSGLFGLTTYLFFIVTVIIWTVKKILTAHNLQLTTFIFALLSAYISILITNFFGFSVVIIGVYFYLIPAFIYSIVTNTRFPELKALNSGNQTRNNESTFSSYQKSLLILLILFITYILYGLLRFWIADSFYAQALSLSKQEDYNRAYPLIASAITIRPGEPVYHDERASITGHLAEIALENREATAASQYIKEAITESDTALTISQQNVSFWKTRTRIFFTLSQVDQSFVENALDSIKIAQELAPTDPKITYNIAILYGRSDQNDKAIEYLKKTIDLKPDYKDAYIALAIFYEEGKQIDKARDTLNLILKRIAPDDAEVKERLEKLK